LTRQRAGEKTSGLPDRPARSPPSLCAADTWHPPGHLLLTDSHAIKANHGIPAGTRNIFLAGKPLRVSMTCLKLHADSGRSVLIRSIAGWGRGLPSRSACARSSPSLNGFPPLATLGRPPLYRDPPLTLRSRSTAAVPEFCVRKGFALPERKTGAKHFSPLHDRRRMRHAASVRQDAVIRSAGASFDSPERLGVGTAHAGLGGITPESKICPKAGFWPDLSFHLRSTGHALRKPAR
jgi:hypothetical protein